MALIISIVARFLVGGVTVGLLYLLNSLGFTVLVAESLFSVFVANCLFVLTQINDTSEFLGRNISLRVVAVEYLRFFGASLPFFIFVDNHFNFFFATNFLGMILFLAKVLYIRRGAGIFYFLLLGPVPLLCALYVYSFDEGWYFFALYFSLVGVVFVFCVGYYKHLLSRCSSAVLLRGILFCMENFEFLIVPVTSGASAIVEIGIAKRFLGIFGTAASVVTKSYEFSFFGHGKLFRGVGITTIYIVFAVGILSSIFIGFYFDGLYWLVPIGAIAICLNVGGVVHVLACRRRIKIAQLACIIFLIFGVMLDHLYLFNEVQVFIFIVASYVFRFALFRTLSRFINSE